MKSIKINQLEIENVKRVKAVTITPAENGVTVIGGNNNQGKTSVLDAIAWALGGERFRPSDPVREGSVLPPHIKLTLSNGLSVERSGKNSALKVTDPEGRRSGQQLLNEFVEALALDLPRFMEQNSKEKAQTLLRVIGLEEQIAELDRKETDAYNRRRTIGQEADRKLKYAKELPFYPDAPKGLVSASELIRQQQEILARNGENQRKRTILAQLTEQGRRLKDQITEREDTLAELRAAYERTMSDVETARRDAAELVDESTEELEQNIVNVEAINIKVRANLDRVKAEDDAAHYQKEYDDLTQELENIRAEKLALLNGAALPLPDLSVEDGELTYKGRRWDGMSGSEQLKVSTAIVRAINPKCGFVLLDKLEQMDLASLKAFGDWLTQEGLQAIATRVSTGGECSILIEDGMIAAAEQAPKKAWEKGVF